MKGAGATYASLQPDEEAAIARLCGFASPDALKATLSGAVSDAVNTLALIAGGPLAEFEMYKSAAVQPDDVDKLEDLGFRDGVSLSGIAETWAGLAGASGARFASVAPGLLTQIGETQRPDRAVKLLDALVRQSGDPRMVFAALGADGPIRDGLVDALGCFGDAAEPLTETAALAAEFFEERGDETPASGGEWISRYAPPKTPSLEAVASWRRQNIARVSLCAATGAMSFGAAADALAAIGETALKEVFGAIRRAHIGADNISLHVFQSSVFGLPGSPTAFGLITKDGAAADGEQFARDFVAAVESLGAGYFEMTADLSRRPKGAAGPLAPNGGAFRAYMQSEAVATDQTALARVRVIAGSEAAQDHAKKSLRSQSGGPKRADLVLRDLDRARAQRLRRDKGGSEWDIPQAEGGLADIDLIIGALIVRHGASLPALQSASADEALDALARANAIAGPAAETLKSARAFWLRLAAARALARWTDPEREPVRGRFASLLARAAEVDRLALVRPLMRGYAEEVSRLYAQLVLGRPASHLAA
jgi:glutamate-ammonia-ligase adenylyltransferase